MLRGTSTERMETARFFSHFSVLLNGGIPVVDAITLFAEDTASAPLAEALRDMAKSLNSGASFHESLAKHPALFPRAVVALMRAGEHSGLLDTTADRAAAELERPADKRTRESETALVLRMLVMTAGVPADEAVPMLDGLVEEKRTAEDVAKTISRMKEERPLKDVLAPLLEGMPAFVTEFVGEFAREDEAEGTATRVILFLDWIAAGLEAGWLTRDRAERPLPQELRTVFHLIAQFIDMGIPLDAAFPKIATAVGRNDVRAALDTIHQTLANGELLADGMAKHPKVFAASATALIRHAEDGGSLPRAAEALEEGIDRGLFVPRAG